MERLKARDSSYSNDFSLKNLRKLLLECVDGGIESSALGNWAYEAWHSHSSKSEDKRFIQLLMEISSEWGLMSQTTQEFSKNFLHKMLAEIEDYMNIGEDEEFEE